MAKRKKNYRFTRHEDDKGVDEILFVDPLPTTIDEAYANAFLRIALIERYKTSPLSGDEWRFSTGLYIRENDRKDWRLISTGASLDAHCAQLYPELFGDFDQGKWPKEFFQRKVGAITFQWKRLPVWSSSYDGKPTDLMVAAAHLPWAYICCGDQGSDPSPLAKLCAQPGCADSYVTIYGLKKRYCRQGHESDPLGQEVIGFCKKHLRRGNCGLQDSDENYVLLHGPGPNEHEPDSSVVKPAKMAPPIFLDSEDIRDL